MLEIFSSDKTKNIRLLKRPSCDVTSVVRESSASPRFFMALFKIIIRNRLPSCGLLRQGESFLHVKYKHSSCSSIFKVSDEVSEAIAKEKPVVALESTIITHGMPYPHNCETALAVEEIIREQVISYPFFLLFYMIFPNDNKLQIKH